MKRLFLITSIAFVLASCGGDNRPGETDADLSPDPGSMNSTVDTTVAPAPPGTDTALETNRMMAPEGVSKMGNSGTDSANNAGNDSSGGRK